MLANHQTERLVEDVQDNPDSAVSWQSLLSNQMENSSDPGADLMGHKRLATNLSSFANMTNTVVGAGVLGLPFAFSKSGFVLGTILLLISACFSWMGLHMISCVCAKTGFPANLRSISGQSMRKSHLFLMELFR